MTPDQNQILARMALYLDHFVYHAAQGKVPTLTEENLIELQGLKDGFAPQEVTDEEAEEVGYQGVPEHWQSPTARSVIRHAIHAIKRHGLRIVKGAAT